MLAGATVAFGVLFVALVVQLTRLGALAGGRPSRALYADEGPPALHLLVNHYVVLGVSGSADSLAPVALLALAAWLPVRGRRWLPLASVAAALLLAVSVLAVGKGVVGDLVGVVGQGWNSSTLSGPATCVILVAVLSCWLLRRRAEGATRRAMWGLAAAVTLSVAATQLYLGHGIGSVVASLGCGAGVVAVVLVIAHRRAGGHQTRAG